MVKYHEVIRSRTTTVRDVWSDDAEVILVDIQLLESDDFDGKYRLIYIDEFGTKRERSIDFAE